MTTMTDATDDAPTTEQPAKQPVQYQKVFNSALGFDSELVPTSQHDETWIKGLWLALMTTLIIVVPVGAWLLSLIPIAGAWLILIGIAFGALDAWVGYKAIGKLRTQKQYPAVT